MFLDILGQVGAWFAKVGARRRIAQTMFSGGHLGRAARRLPLETQMGLLRNPSAAGKFFGGGLRREAHTEVGQNLRYLTGGGTGIGLKRKGVMELRHHRQTLQRRASFEGRKGWHFPPGISRGYSTEDAVTMVIDAQRHTGWGAIGKTALGVGMLDVGLLLTSNLDFLGQRVPEVDEEQALTQQFILPRQAYTQRQKGLMAIHQSQLSTRNSLGSEASAFHR